MLNKCQSQQHDLLSDNVTRKFIESYNVADYQVETENGEWVDITASNKTIPYKIWEIKLENGLSLKCADTHILIDENGEEVFAMNSFNHNIKTKKGISKVIEVIETNECDYMYDLSVDSNEHTYYTNDILSHNTITIAAYVIWYIVFNDLKTVAILANKATTSREILSRIKLMYENLPYWMQHGVKKWNEGSIELENTSKVFTGATTKDGIRGKSCNLLLVDEAAIIPNNIADAFFAAIYPVISAGKNTKVVLTSTALGYNHFWKYWHEAEKNINGFIPVRVFYYEHPDRDEHWAEEQKKLLGALMYRQEVLCDFLGSSNTLLDGDILSRLSSKEFIYNKDNLTLLEQPKSNHIYIIIVDSAEGIGGDYTVASIFDITEMPYKFIGKYRSNTVSYLLVPTILHKIATSFNNAYVLVEINNGPGLQIANILYEDLEYENLLRVLSKDKRGQYLSFSGSYGVKTTKQVKRLGCQAFKSLVEDNKLLIQDEDAIRELTTFIEKNGTYKADDGYHDDICMTMVLFAWCFRDPLFNDLTNHNARKLLLDRKIEEIEQNMLPTGFFVDAASEHSEGESVDFVETVF